MFLFLVEWGGDYEGKKKGQKKKGGGDGLKPPPLLDGPPYEGRKSKKMFRVPSPKNSPGGKMGQRLVFFFVSERVPARFLGPGNVHVGGHRGGKKGNPFSLGPGPEKKKRGGQRAPRLASWVRTGRCSPPSERKKKEKKELREEKEERYHFCGQRKKKGRGEKRRENFASIQLRTAKEEEKKEKECHGNEIPARAEKRVGKKKKKKRVVLDRPFYRPSGRKKSELPIR